MNETYVINDLENYAILIRENAVLSISENHNENLDEFISVNQVCQLISANAIGFDEEDNFLIDEESYNITFDQIRTWLYNVGLARLASAGHVECAWDNDANEMIFWVAESKSQYKTSNNNGVKNESQPTRKSNKSSKRKNT
jgi:hypothetical protein